MRLCSQPHLAVVVLGAAVACGSPEPASVDPGEAVDVSASPVENLTTEFDEVAPQRSEEALSGVLPSGFPADVPVYTPSSLIEFGDGGGDRFVLLATETPADAVRATYRATLESAGWARVGGGSREERYSKDDRTLRVEVRSKGESSEIRIAY